MKSLSSHITEHLQFEETTIDHIQNNISIHESYLRIDSDSYAEMIREKRRLYINEQYVPVDEDEKYVLENLSSGDKAIYVNKGRRKEVKVDIPMNNPDRTSDKKRFVVYRKTDKEDEESGLPIAKKIKFGSWAGNLDIRNDNEGAVKSFWARQKCDSKSDQDTAGWWACYTPEKFGDLLKLRGGKSRW